MAGWLDIGCEQRDQQKQARTDGWAQSGWYGCAIICLERCWPHEVHLHERECESDTRQGCGWSVLCRVRHKDGRYVWVSHPSRRVPSVPRSLQASQPARSAVRAPRGRRGRFTAAKAQHAAPPAPSAPVRLRLLPPHRPRQVAALAAEAPPPPRPDTRARTHSARQIKTSGRLTAKVRSRARPREHAPTRICALVRGDAVCVTRVRGVVRRPTQGPPWPAVAPCSGSIGCHRGSELLTRGAARAGRGLCAPAGAGPAGDRPGRGPPPALRVSALSAEFRVLRRQAPPSMALAVQARSTGRPGSALWLEFEGDKCD